MVSPSQTQSTVPPPTEPTTPPTEPSSSNPANVSTSQAPNNTNTNQPTTTTTTTTPPATNAQTPASQPAQIPSTSLQDGGKSRRPRDVRLIHMLLASLGITAYQERIPLQLLDFAYRYTSSVLQDAVHLSTEGYAGMAGEPGAAAAGTSGRGGAGGANDVNTVSLSALRLSIASRLHYQFQTGLPKEFLMDVATERNRVALPGATRGFDSGGNANRTPQAHQSLMMGGMRLPPERFCLTGVGWNMKEEWDSEGEEEVEEPAPGTGEDGEEGAGEDDDDGKMEDIFGEDTAMGEGDGDGDGDGDRDMEDV